jgi:hypothetical protein
MIVLRDQIEIKVSPEQIFDWLCRLEENYQTWHPAHVSCRFLTGGPLQEGTIIYCEEYLHGDLHKLKFRATKVVPNSRLDYQIAPGMQGSFVIEPHGVCSLFTADIYLGFRFPLLGWLFDKIAWVLLSNRVVLLKQHMAEEGKNLKNILENAASNVEK